MEYLYTEEKDYTIVSGLLVAGAAGYCIDRIAETTLPCDLINGTTPRWSLLVSIASQAFLLPTVFLMAWARHDYNLHWFHCTWEELGDDTYENLYIFCLFGYLSKDLFLLKSKLIVVHHIVCMALICTSWFMPWGGTCIIFASMELELGTATWNARSLYPVCAEQILAFGGIPNDGFETVCMLTQALHAVVMTMSNLVAVGLAVWFATWEEPTIVFKVPVIAATVGLAFGRQLEVKWEWLLGSPNKRKES